MRTYTPNLSVGHRYIPPTIAHLSNNSYPIPAWGTGLSTPEVYEIASLKRFCEQQFEYLQKPLQKPLQDKNIPSRMQPVRHITAVWGYRVFLCLSIFTALYHPDSNAPLRLTKPDTFTLHAETTQNPQFLDAPDTTETSRAIRAVNSSLEDIKASVMDDPASGFVNPVAGFPITSSFGSRVHPISGDVRFHKGIDIGTPIGTPIRTAKEGQVVFAGWSGTYGKKVIISHGEEYETLYAHLDELLVKEGDLVAAGQIIGLSGNTGYVSGPHLHFEIWLNEVALNPLDYFQ
ncbi:hypothetical protein C7B76_18545 [filamentous cyanobacterium CCP2]|nr:hypothetical protein C7B76_18545 [filamentous cyanobacterium CCP2]